MIKRLKWNVLYGGGDGEESDSGFTSGSSSDSEDRRELLKRLVKNDPFLNLLNSSDEDDSGRNESLTDGHRSEEMEGGLLRTKGDISLTESGFRVCEPCNKKLLSATDLESHLRSKKHRVRVKSVDEGESEGQDCHGKIGGSRFSKKEILDERRKEAVKRKLKRLKQRKWEREQVRAASSQAAALNQERPAQGTLACETSLEKIERSVGDLKHSSKENKDSKRIAKTVRFEDTPHDVCRESSRVATVQKRKCGEILSALRQETSERLKDTTANRDPLAYLRDKAKRRKRLKKLSRREE